MSLMGLLLSSVVITACQPSDQNKEKNKENVDQVSVSEPVVETLRLIGSTQRIPIQMEPCRGNGCPEITIDRLATNQPVLDKIIDQAILKQIQSTMDVDETLEGQNKKSQELNQSTASSASENVVKMTAVESLASEVRPYVNNFFKINEDLKKMGVNHQITFSVSPKILNSQAPLATVVLNSSHYLGGAHGSSAQQYFNFDLESQKLISLNQVIQTQKQNQFKQLAYDAFKTWVIDNKLAEDVQEYEQAWKFSLSQNFYLGQQGIILQYQEYEIGPYVVGLPRLTIPYEQLKDILKPEYLPEAFKTQLVNTEAVSASESKVIEVKKS